MFNTSSEFSSVEKQLISASEQPQAEAQAQPTEHARNAFLSFTPSLYLRRHPNIIVGTSLLLVLFGGGYLKRSRGPTYAAQSVIYVSPARASALTEDQYNSQYDAFMEQQVYAVTRYDNLKQAIDKHRDIWTRPNEDEQSAVKRLEGALKVEQMGHSYQMSITLKTSKPDGLADFLNDITKGYLDNAHRDEFFGHERTVSTLLSDRKRLTDELDADLQKQDILLAELGIARFDSKSASNPFDIQMEKLRDQLSEAHERRAEADAKVAAYRDTGNSDLSALQQAAAEQVHIDPAMQTMTGQLNSRRSSLLLQMNGLTPQNPLYVQAQSELATIDRQLDDLTKKATSKVASQLSKKYTTEREQAAQLESQLDSDLTKTRELAAQAAPKLQRAEVLGIEIQRLQANYTEVDSRINSLGMEGDLPSSEHIVAAAVQPLRPEASHIALYWSALVFVSLIGGFAAGMLADRLDHNIYTGEDIQHLIGFYPIGMLLDEEDFSAPMRSEYFLRLAAGIDQVCRRSAARTFVFTSAGAGDTRNLVGQLGLELAKNGLKTLVINVKNSQSIQLKNRGNDSLSEHRSRSSDVRLSSSVLREELDLISQPGLEPSIELFQIIDLPPQNLSGFVRKTSTAYNTILVAADPLLTSAYTEQLARTADGTVLVAESGKTTKKQLTRCAKLLERMKISGIAIILSQIRLRRADHEIMDNIPEYDKQVTVQS